MAEQVPGTGSVARAGRARDGAATRASRRRRGLPSWAVGVLGAAGLVGLWWVLAAAVFANVGPGNAQAIPTPPQVVAQWVDDGWELYGRNFWVTTQEAARGFAWGCGLALLLSVVVLLVPRLEAAAMQVAIITYCLPIVALGMVVSIVVDAPKSGQPAGTAVFLAAMSCFFTTVVGALLGLKAADQAQLDVVRVYGGSRWTQVRKVRLVAAVPAILAALQIAVPSAFLGAILGEYLGGVDTGVGVALTAAQNGMNTARVWGLALASGAVAMAGYALFGALARLAAPWSRGQAR